MVKIVVHIQSEIQQHVGVGVGVGEMLSSHPNLPRNKGFLEM